MFTLSFLQALASCDVLLRALDTFRSEIGAPESATPLLTALRDLLTRLQPLESGTPAPSLSAQPLLAQLRAAFTGGGTAAPLPLGEEHDVAEACELLMQALTAETEAAFRGHAKARLEARAALRAVLSPAPVPDAALAGWRAARMPYEGLLSAQMQCVRCRHHFSTHYTPLATLSLPLPVAGAAALGVLRVTPGSTLAPCFEATFGFELVTGVGCPGCSIKASLEAAGLVPPPKKAAMLPAPSSPRAVAGAARSVASDKPSISPEVEAVHDLWRSVAARGPLPDDAATAAALAAAGAPPRTVRSQVTRRSVVARWPPLLALHLRRAFWTPEGHQMKVVGPLRFPLRLALQAGGAQLVSYMLVAAVEHAGMSTNSGHYVAYRSVGEEVGAAAAAAGGPPRRWVRVSDEDVQAVAESDVMAVQASMLFYQRVAEPRREAAAGGGA